MDKGRILKTYNGFYYVLSELTGMIVECRLRGRLKKEKPDILTGDFVIFSMLDDKKQGIIEEICDRYSLLRRPAIANIDQVLLVFSIKTPEFSSGLLDRFLLLSEMEGLKSVICISKIDLGEDRLNYLGYYKSIGYLGTNLSVRTGAGLNELKKILENKTTVLAGPSGSGKSSFLQLLVPELQFSIGAVSEKLGRGRHTTKHAELLHLDGCLVADTPGFTSLELSRINLVSVKECYPEFLSLSSRCKFRNSCIHENEPECAVKEAVENQKIPEWRYNNYISILKEIRTSEGRRKW